MPENRQNPILRQWMFLILIKLLLSKISVELIFLYHEKKENYKKMFLFRTRALFKNWNLFKPENWEPFSKRILRQCYEQDHYIFSTLFHIIRVKYARDLWFLGHSKWFLIFQLKTSRKNYNSLLNLDPKLGFPSITSEGLIPMSFISGLLSARAVSAFWTIFIWWIREEDFPGNLPPFSRSDFI